MPTVNWQHKNLAIYFFFYKMTINMCTNNISHMCISVVLYSNYDKFYALVIRRTVECK